MFFSLHNLLPAFYVLILSHPHQPIYGNILHFYSIIVPVRYQYKNPYIVNLLFAQKHLFIKKLPESIGIFL